MAWSFVAIGKSAAVAKAARAAKETNKCAEPEETHRVDCLETIARMAEGLIGVAAVQVNASGSQWKDGEVVKSHSLLLEFKPIYGFLVE